MQQKKTQKPRLTSSPNRQPIRPTTNLPTRSITRHSTPTRRLLVVPCYLITAETFSTKLRARYRIPRRITRSRTPTIVHLSPNIRTVAQSPSGLRIGVTPITRPPRSRCRCRSTQTAGCWRGCRVTAFVLPHRNPIRPTTSLGVVTLTFHVTAISGR